jgi:hypothetical protein
LTELDINSLIKAGALQIKDEHPDDRQARLRIKEADAKAVRLRENMKFFAGLLLVLAAVIGCAVGAIWGDTSVKPWCLATLTTIISGSVGYLAGEAKGKQTGT